MDKISQSPHPQIPTYFFSAAITCTHVELFYLDLVVICASITQDSLRNMLSFTCRDVGGQLKVSSHGLKHSAEEGKPMRVLLAVATVLRNLSLAFRKRVNCWILRCNAKYLHSVHMSRCGQPIFYGRFEKMGALLSPVYNAFFQTFLKVCM